MKGGLFEPPLQVYEARAVQAELGEPVGTEGEEDLLRPHHTAVRHLLHKHESDDITCM